MTVIMGCKTPNKIYLGADNRTSTIDDVTIRDNDNKIVVVNDNVTVAFAGYGGTQRLFEHIMENSKKRELYRVEAVLSQLKMIYWFYKLTKHKKASEDALALGSRFIIAGKNRKDECCMYIMSILHGKLEKPSMTDKFLFPPSDASAKECWGCFVKNLTYSKDDFIQKTVKDVAKMSKVVSSSGDIWIHDIITGESIKKHFS